MHLFLKCDTILAMKTTKKAFRAPAATKLLSFGDLCEMFGCVPQLDGRTWHDGLYDAVACANLALLLGM